MTEVACFCFQLILIRSLSPSRPLSTCAHSLTCSRSIAHSHSPQLRALWQPEFNCSTSNYVCCVQLYFCTLYYVDRPFSTFHCENRKKFVLHVHTVRI